MQTIKRFIGLLAPFAGLAAGGSALTALTVLFNTGLLAVAALLLAKASIEPEILLLMPLIVGVRFFGIGRAVLRYLERLINHSIAYRILGRLRVTLYSRLEPLVPDRLRNYTQGRLYNRFIGDIDTLQYFYIKAVPVPVGALAVYAVSALFLSLWDPALAGVLLVGMAVAGLVIPWLSLIGEGERQARTGALRDRLSSRFLAFQEGLDDLALYGRLDSAAQDLQTLCDRLTRASRRTQMRRAFVDRLSRAAGTLTMLWALWVWAAHAQEAAVYTSMLAMVVLGAFEAASAMPEAMLQTQQSAAAAEGIAAVLDQPGPQEGRIRTLPDDLTLAFDHVCFHYHHASVGFAEDLDLTLPYGTHAVVVGASGSGKTTFARLASGLWQPDGGRVSLGGTDLRDLDPTTLHRTIGLVQQDTSFFSATIRENLLLAASNKTDRDIWQALELVEMAEPVRALPQGLDTLLFDNASAFSGGQRQRLAIARIVLADPAIVILDEATQKLDRALADRILVRLEAWAAGKTLIRITHTLQQTDQAGFIYVFAYGRMVEQGRHEALMARENGIYRQLKAIEDDQF